MGHARECQLFFGSPAISKSVRYRLLTMLLSSDSDGFDHSEMPILLHGSDPFNTLPDELVLKIMKMAIKNIVDENTCVCSYVCRTYRRLAPRFNFMVKVVSKISPRYVTMLFHHCP